MLVLTMAALLAFASHAHVAREIVTVQTTGKVAYQVYILMGTLADAVLDILLGKILTPKFSRRHHRSLANLTLGKLGQFSSPHRTVFGSLPSVNLQLQMRQRPLPRRAPKSREVIRHNVPIKASGLDAECSLMDVQTILARHFEKPTKLEVQETVFGRGLVATDDIDEGEKMLTVPWCQTLYVFENIEGDDTSSDVRLALELLRVLDQPRAGMVDGNDPRVDLWKDYRCVLPLDTGAAALWSVDIIEELQSRPAVDATIKMREYILNQISRHCNESKGPSENELRWALSLVHSRSFSVPTPAGTVRILVPFADLFNHRSETPSETALFVSREPWEPVTWQVANWGTNPLKPGRSATIEFYSMWRYAAGEEVLIPYGDGSSADMLASSGFFPDSNAADFVPIYEDLQELVNDVRLAKASPEATQEKISKLLSMDAVDMPLAVRPGGVSMSAHLLACLRVVLAGSDELLTIREIEDSTIGHSILGWHQGSLTLWDKDFNASTGDDEESLLPGQLAVDRMALKHAAARCLEVLADMPTSLQEDEALLRKLRHGAEDKCRGERARHLESAVRYRLGVKQILVAFIDEVKNLGVEPLKF